MSASLFKMLSRQGHFLLFLSSLIFMVVSASASDCIHLASLTIDHVTITKAEVVDGGVFAPASGDPITGLPVFCRVAATLKPSPDSDIRIEVWMPEDSWNGRIEGTGNGGFAGTILYKPLAAGLRLGYAVANTDMGMATPPGADASVFIDRPERWIDWGYRSTHEMTVATKELVKAFYSRDAAKAYFVGCSTGGEQALMEAQRFPDDYDGIVGGAAANNRTGVHISILWTFAALQNSPESFLPAQKASILSKAVLNACDALDGVRDGLIADPQRCNFDPGVLECEKGDQESCLTRPQVETVRKIYSGPIDARTGRDIYPGLARGGESGWDTRLPPPNQANPVPYAPIFEWVFDAHRDWRDFDFSADSEVFDRKLRSYLNATSPDLDTFRAHGHKLLVYHGWSDPLVAPGEAINYYNSVVRRDRKIDRSDSPQSRKDLRPSARGTISNSYRLFMVPGMFPCGGGPGPSDFAPLDAVVKWVERGIAPDTLTARKALPDDGGSHAVMERLLCPYPSIAQYQGSGDVDDASNYACAEPVTQPPTPK
jgi:feruloyl esterase